MTNAISLFQVTLPLVFGIALAVAAILMLKTGRAPSYYRHAVQRSGMGSDSTHYFWSILLATMITAVFALSVGIVQIAVA